MRRSPRVFPALFGLALLAACGTGSAGAPPTSAPQPTVAPTAAPQTTAAPQPTVAPTSAPAPTAAPQPTGTSQPTAPPTDAPAPTAAPQPTVAPTAATPSAPPLVALRQVTGDVSRPVHVTHGGDGSGRIFVVEKRGTIAIVRDGAAQAERFLDIVDRVGSDGSEQGLLSVAFHPRYAENGFLYVNYTDRRGDTVISRFSAQGDRADAASERILLQIDQPYANHNGGLNKFGPDGYLYIGMGDGGSGGDPQGNGQSLDTLLGKMLRIDVDGGDPYGIPADNPWAAGGARPEIWAYGLRNPWRFSFDRATGDLYIADVGQNVLEEINFQPAASRGGENYGWNPMEGDRCFRGACDPSAYVPPIDVYDHGQGCSVTGGYVYRGAAFPALQGFYLFGDYCSGLVWTLRPAPDGGWQRSEPLATDLPVSSFGEDEAGELYVTTLDGGLYQVVVE